MYTVKEALALLGCLPRQSLGFYPTPLHRLDRLSDKLGVNLFIKRDDFSGISLFGGNKVRKLEYLLGQAKAEGCHSVITFGATQSNHAMQTAAAARRCGLEPILYLVDLVDTREARANLLLDSLYGAEIHIVPAPDGEEAAEARARQLADARQRQLEKEGRRVALIPMGGASPLGTAGFIGGWLELSDQCLQLDTTPDYVFQATGTGSTLAGMVAGKAMTGGQTQLVAVQVSPKDEGYAARITRLANEALALIGARAAATEQLFTLDADHWAPGYEQPNEQSNEAIRLLARTEGLLADPVYTGKALAGMLSWIESGRVSQGSTVVFLHTGGATALFSEGQIIGSLGSFDPQEAME
ncbi:MAG: D-cysteine desulfhydrase family protein [Clostridiales bacterium]|nr:D-cysteine desulfhydrase family protein [Clostridiales bacterium]